MRPMCCSYLSTLEVTKANVRAKTEPWAVEPATKVALADLIAGATASVVAQTVLVSIGAGQGMIGSRSRMFVARNDRRPGSQVIVPIDVVSQTQMIRSRGDAGAAAAPSGLATAQAIVRAQGVGGLFRGLGVSLAVFVPSSAIWWGGYGAYQRLLADLLPPDRWEVSSSTTALGVQTAAGVCAGLTSGLLTTPLDVLKTRLQTAAVEPGQPLPSLRSVATKLLSTEGPRGLLRGAVPRMASTALWGTAMVNAYETVKRLSVMDRG